MFYTTGGKEGLVLHKGSKISVNFTALIRLSAFADALVEQAAKQF